MLTAYYEPDTVLGHISFNCNYYKCHCKGEEFKGGGQMG